MNTIAFFKTIRQTLDEMTDEEAGALMKALFAHSDGEEVDLSGTPSAVRAVYPLLVDATDRLNSIREKKSKAGSIHGTNREQTRNTNGTNEEQNGNRRGTHNHNHIKESITLSSNTKDKRFVPPSVEEVRAYAREKGYNVDPERFVNFYDSKNWYVGKNKMTNWHSALANWSAKNKSAFNFDQRGTDYDALLMEAL